MKRVLLIFTLLGVVAGVKPLYGAYNRGETKNDAGGYSYGVNDFARTSAIFTEAAFDFSAAANVADILPKVPGVFFQNSGLLDFGMGAYAGSVTKIRGIGGDVNSGILTLVDDRPLSMAVFRHSIFDILALDYAESVEIIKGPSSVEYGNMATNGVIRIRTKIPVYEGMKTKIKASAGSYFTQNYFFNNAMKKSDYDYSVSGGYKYTAGFRPNSESSQQNYSIKSGYAYNNEIRYGGGVSYSDAIFYNPGPKGALWDREQEGCKIKNVSWDVRAEKNAADFKGKLIFYSDLGANDFMKSTVPGSITQVNPAGVTMPGTDIGFSNYGVKLMEEWNLIPGNVIKIGFDWQNFGGTYENYPYDLAQKKNGKRYENDYAPYIVLAQKVGITAIMLGFRYAYNDQWGHEFIPQGGLIFSLYDGNKVYCNISKGYATPAMATVLYSGEENLKPEDFWQVEAGIEQQFGDVFDMILSAYQTQGQNTLKIDPVDFKPKNNGFTLVRGVEGDLSIKYKDLFRFGGNAVYCEPGEKSANVTLLTMKSYLSVKPVRSFELKVEAEFSKNRYGADKKLEKLADYLLFNASAYYKADFLGPDSGFFAEASNILNAEYEVKKGYPAPGLLIKGGVVIKL